MQAQSTQQASDPGSWIASITYRSEAVSPLPPSDLRHLVARARHRNRRSDVTGMLLSDGHRFLQTLEGPTDALEPVWASIQRDPRHHAIEVLSQHIVPARLFTGWDMQFHDRGNTMPAKMPAPGDEAFPLTGHIPAAAQHALDGDDGRLNALIAELLGQGWVGDALVKHLLEPAARMLGDFWLADDCSEVDLTIGLSMLQLAGHATHAGPSPERIRGRRYSILLATAPGEPHMLGPTLLGDMFHDAGWDVEIAFPENDEELTRQLRTQRPDALDIALSDAVPRDHALTTLRETIEKSRRTSPEDVMVVSVGGRLFAEAMATARSVGADHARDSAAGTCVHLARLVEARRKPARPIG